MRTTFASSFAISAALGCAAVPVHAAECRMGGERVILLMRSGSQCDGGGGGQDGTGDIWKEPPPPLIGPPAWLPASTFAITGGWRIGATADFNDDGECDVVWVRDFCPAAGIREIALTMTSIDGVMTLPAGGGIAEVPSTWTLVGSGQFVCTPGVTCPGGLQPDGVPDLVWWNPTERKLEFWGSDGNGAFPDTLENRPRVTGPSAPWRPVAVANLDGAGLPEILWRNDVSGNLVYWGLGYANGPLGHETGGFLTPTKPEEMHWTLRAATDLNGDGKEDLLFQNICSDAAAVWNMNGPTRTTGGLMNPSVFPPHEATCVDGAPTGVHWEILGPR